MRKTVAILLLVATIVSLTGCSLLYGNNTIKFDKKGALVIAHRGLSGLEVENTESAFIAAGEHSYYGIEADVRRTADGRFIICHDATLEKLTGRDISVEASTFDELMSIPLTEMKGQSGKEERLTYLETYISICKRYDKQAILELKSSFSREEISQIIKTINEHNYLDRVIFISFDYDNLLYVREISPEQSVQYLFSEVTDEIIEKLIRDKVDAGINFTSLTKRILNKLHSAGLKVNCWTVDIPFIAEQLANIGVDYITTNILE